MVIPVTLIATTTSDALPSPFTLNHGRTAVYHGFRPPIPRRTDSSPDRRLTRPREDTHLAGSGAVSPMDGCQDHGRIPWGLQEEDPG